MKRILVAMACAVLLSHVAFAQLSTSVNPNPFQQGPFRLRTEIGTRFSGGLGYQNPELTLSISPELNLKRFYARGSGFYRTGNKLDTGDGRSTGGQFEAYLRASRFLFGGGLNYVKLTTSQYQKSSFRPLVGGAIDFKVDEYPSRFFAHYVLKGTDDHNGLQGAAVRLEMDLKPKVRITPFNLAVYRFYPTYGPELGTKTGFSATFGVSYVLWSPKRGSTN